MEFLYPRGTSSDYGTVQKLLERLEEKGAVIRDRNSWPHVFSAKHPDELVAHLTSQQAITIAQKIRSASAASGVVAGLASAAAITALGPAIFGVIAGLTGASLGTKNFGDSTAKTKKDSRTSK